MGGFDWRLRLLAYRPGERHEPHWHRRTTITLVYAGSLLERCGRRECWAGPLSVVVKPAGTLHADRFGPEGARTLQISLGHSALEDALGDARELGHWRWLHGGSALPPFLDLLSQAWHGAAEESLEKGVFDLLALLDGIGPEAEPTRRTPPWLRRVRQCVEDEYAQGLRVRDLARAAGVHPVTLARQFRRFYGASVSERLRQRRVQAAAALLDGKQPLVDVALECGFADQSHLCRDFKSCTGRTPSQYRLLIRSCQAVDGKRRSRGDEC